MDQHDVYFDPIDVPERLSTGVIISLAHQLYGSRWGLIVGTSAVAFLIIIAMGIAATIAETIWSTASGVTLYVRPISFAVQALLGTPLSLGPIYVAVRLYRGEYATFSDVWIGFSRWPQVVAVGVIVQIASTLVSVTSGIAVSSLSNAAGPSNPVVIVGLFLLVLILAIISIYVAIRLYFATLLCVDTAGPRLGIKASLRASLDVTRGHALAMFLAALVLGLTAGISFICLVVPYFLYGAPIIAAGSACAYCIACHESGLIPLAPYTDCPYCKYDLSGTDSTICPECGAEVERDPRSFPRT